MATSLLLPRVSDSNLPLLTYTIGGFLITIVFTSFLSFFFSITIVDPITDLLIGITLTGMFTILFLFLDPVSRLNNSFFSRINPRQFQIVKHNFRLPLVTLSNSRYLAEIQRKYWAMWIFLLEFGIISVLLILGLLQHILGLSNLPMDKKNLAVMSLALIVSCLIILTFVFYQIFPYQRVKKSKKSYLIDIRYSRNWILLLGTVVIISSAVVVLFSQYFLGISDLPIDQKNLITIGLIVVDGVLLVFVIIFNHVLTRQKIDFYHRLRLVGEYFLWVQDPKALYFLKKPEHKSDLEILKMLEENLRLQNWEIVEIALCHRNKTINDLVEKAKNDLLIIQEALQNRAYAPIPQIRNRKRLEGLGFRHYGELEQNLVDLDIDLEKSGLIYRELRNNVTDQLNDAAERHYIVLPKQITLSDGEKIHINAEFLAYACLDEWLGRLMIPEDKKQAYQEYEKIINNIKNKEEKWIYQLQKETKNLGDNAKKLDAKFSTIQARIEKRISYLSRGEELAS